jgi:hypothetical protein
LQSVQFYSPEKAVLLRKITGRALKDHNKQAATLQCALPLRMVMITFPGTVAPLLYGTQNIKAIQVMTLS